MKYLIRLFMISFLNFVLYAQNVPAEEKIVVNLDSEEQIQNAMNEIKSANQEDFKYLEQLRTAKAPEFKSKLYNRVYALRLKQKIDTTISKRKLGYYEKIKEANKRVQFLVSLYPKLMKPEEKTEWEKRLEEAAEQRYLIEVEMKQSQIKNLEDQIDAQKKFLADFEASKQKYITRFITKTKVRLKK